MHKLERTIFETSRAAEYFDVRELQTQTGQRRENFPTVVFKELVDNALDACETAGVAPRVDIHARVGGDTAKLTISDNGPGIPPDLVGKVLNFDTRTSDKAAYRSPTRGAQGNALKTVVGIPYALGGKAPMVIEARGQRHIIRAWQDPAGEIHTPHAVDEMSDSGGTRVSISVPFDEGMDYNPEHWARSFALFNPHAWVVADIGSYPGNSGTAKTAKTYKPTAVFPGWRKFLPTDLTSAHWYGASALQRLVFSHIKDARTGGRDLPLGEFVRQFRGLSSTAKAKAVTAGFGEIKYLSDFQERPDRVVDLLTAMQATAKAPSHNVLGAVGEEHFRTYFEDAYEVKEFVYKTAKGRFPSGLPFVFEFALATLEKPGDLYFGINFSPSFGDPLVGTQLVGPKFAAEGIRGFLRESYALPDSGGSYHGYRAPANVAVAVHIITPAPVFMDRGKSRLQLEEV